MVAYWDNTTPSVVVALDRALRAFGGEPTYALTDNERPVSIDHVCRAAVRNPEIRVRRASVRVDGRDVRAGRPAARAAARRLLGSRGLTWSRPTTTAERI